MVTIRKINQRKDYKKFVKFPAELYKDCPYYVPPMEMDEYKMTTKRNAHYDECEQAYFLAEEDGKVVGRIACLVMHAFNEKNNCKYARFTRFDVIENEEVAHLLLKTAEDWAREQGMEFIHGPLGYDDMEREGLLVEGFDTIGSFITSYNYEYYKTFIENYGYKPDARWVEWRFNLPQKADERVERIAEVVEKRYGFHEVKFRSMNDLIKNYGNEFFDLIDETFSNLYGVFPYNDKLRKQIESGFRILLKKKFVCMVLNKQNEFIGFGLTWPSLAKAMHETKGRALPFGIFKWLKALIKPTAAEFGIIAVKKDYQKFGVTAFIIKKILDRINEMHSITYADTGVQLENNTSAIASLDMFERTAIRRKICYIKNLKEEKDF